MLAQRLSRGALRIRSPITLRALRQLPRHNNIETTSQLQQQHHLSSSSTRHFASAEKKDTIVRKKGQTFIPRKAPVLMTDTARTFFQSLLENKKDDVTAGIILNFHQSSSGEPRMVFSFDFVKTSDLGPEDEGVSLEVLEDGTPKPPAESLMDGKPKLYIHHNAFMKVLGSKVDVDLETLKLTMYDRDGNVMDPNA